MNKRIFSFKGSHKEIGRYVGELYSKWGRKKINCSSSLKKHAPKQISLYEKYYPEYLEYLEGIAEGLGLDKDNVIKFFTTIFIPFLWGKENPGQNRCSTFILRNKKGIFIGRNYDWREITEENSALFKFNFTDNKTHSFTAISDMGVFEKGIPANPSTFILVPEDGWNSAGLYISMNGAPEIDRGYGISEVHLPQLLLERCSTTSQALELIEKIPIPYTKIFIIADISGDLAIVEKVTDRENKTIRSKNFVLSTNHFNHKDLVHYNEKIFEFVPFHSTFARYHYLNLVLNKQFEEIGIDLIMKVMNKPPLAQEWRGQENGDAVTVWTLGLELLSRKFIINFGPLSTEPLVINEKTIS